MSEEINSAKKDSSKEIIEEASGHGGIHFTKQELVFLVCESICILFYGLFTTYDGELTSPLSTKETDKVTTAFLTEKYPLF